MRIELEAKEEASVLDFPELDLESNAGVQQPRAVGVRGFVRFRIDESNQGRQLEVAEQDRRAANHRQNLLHGLPFGFGRMAEMTDGHEDERNYGVTHPGILVHSVRKTYSPQYTNGVCSDPGTLWIVATPIGTLGDLTPRAREILSTVDLILAEDTRRARRLLAYLEVSARGRLQSLHEHNEKQKVPELLAKLREGASVALISDAGTPVLSDPGYLLVRAARNEDLPVCSVPGASAFTTALAASGQPPLPATLCGFLPPRGGPRQRRIAELDAAPWTMVILLSPHRLARELADLAEVLGGERRATLLAELSKRYERAVQGTLSELARRAEEAKPRGEYVLVVAPRNQPAGDDSDPEAVRAEYQRAIAEGMDRRRALRATAQRLGIPRRTVFDLVAVESEKSVGD